MTLLGTSPLATKGRYCGIDFAVKFLAHEYKDVKAAIAAHKLPYEAFTFTKKKGRLHIQFEGGGEPFIFFRKTETRLTEDRQWKKNVIYYIGPRPQAIELHDWNIVMSAFSTWLKRLDSGR